MVFTLQGIAAVGGGAGLNGGFDRVYVPVADFAASGVRYEGSFISGGVGVLKGKVSYKPTGKISEEDVKLLEKFPDVQSQKNSGGITKSPNLAGPSKKSSEEGASKVEREKAKPSKKGLRKSPVSGGLKTKIKGVDVTISTDGLTLAKDGFTAQGSPKLKAGVELALVLNKVVKTGTWIVELDLLSDTLKDFILLYGEVMLEVDEFLSSL